jgi:hypothetical protein
LKQQYYKQQKDNKHTMPGSMAGKNPSVIPNTQAASKHKPSASKLPNI